MLRSRSAAEPRIVGVCDLGTFSALILIVRIQQTRLSLLLEEVHTVDLAAATSKRKTIGRDGVDRAERIVAYFDDLTRRLGCRRAVVVCTAAIREAANRAQILRRLRSATDHRVLVVSPRQEAQLTATGALTGLRKARRAPVIIDVGGGSTEIIDTGSNAFQGIPIGAALATELWRTQIPRRFEKRPDMYRRLSQAAVECLPNDPFGNLSIAVGVGGTITTLAAMKIAALRFEPRQIHGITLSKRWIGGAALRLSQLNNRDIAALIPFAPERAHVLTAGTFLWEAVFNRLSLSRLTVSVRGLRWGAARRLAFGPPLRGER